MCDFLSRPDFGARPSNFLEFPTNITLCYTLLIYLFVQVAALLIQYLVDPRLSILTTHLFGFMLPPKYNYHRPIPMSVLEEGECKCVICMSEIEIPNRVASDSANETLIDHSTKSNHSHEWTASKDIMVTPCNHVFHTICLERWKEYKLECPLCKKDLPIL